VDSEGNERLPRYLGRGTLTSLFVHFGLLFPLITLAFLLGGREQKQREEEVELTFEEVNPDDLPADLPPIEATPPTPTPKEPLALRPEEPVKPEPPPPPEPEQPPPPTPPPPKPEQQRAKEKSVDFEIDKEEEPSPEAKYLAEKNNRVEQETRADRTNLEKEQKGEASTSPSERQDQEVGDEEDKIAKLEDRKSKLGRQAPQITPHQDESLAPSDSNDRKSLLSMRETPERKHEISPETVDPALPRDPQGIRAMPEEELQSMQDLQGASGQSRRSSLRLSSRQYQYLFGDDAEAAAAFSAKEKSKKKGRFSDRMAKVQAALENFLPEVRPGNQTELNTRAAPFAAFIARMHRSIHEHWGFGFLVDLESKGMTDPMNNPDLVTKLEIVMNGDGTVDKITVIKPSGLLPYDVAAIDVVYSAGPFPDPPRAIRSRNGKIYVHWNFHRNERQCATSGVDYFILDNPPADSDTGDRSTVPTGPMSSRRGGASTGGAGRTPAPGAGHEGHGHGEGGGEQSGQGGGGRNEDEAGGRSLRRLGRDLPPSGDEELAEARRAAAGGRPEAAQQAARQAEAGLARAEDPKARGVAEHFFAALAGRDTSRMMAQTALPFRSREGVAAQSKGQLKALLDDLSSEYSAATKFRGLQMYSAAGVRTLLGGMPPAYGDGRGMLFAVAQIGGDTFVLVLGKGNSGWRATGLVRR
jgi:hypothetical protein